MSLVISNELLKASRLTEDELFLEIILLLYQQDKLSLGKAAELLNMSQIQFQRLISERGICVHYDGAELREDVRHIAAHRIPVGKIVMPSRDKLHE
jgi:predicted HTH domain antitoxin